VLVAQDLRPRQVLGACGGPCRVRAGPTDLGDAGGILLAPYRTRYFEVIEPEWSQRSIGMATRLVRGLFPISAHARSLARAVGRAAFVRARPIWEMREASRSDSSLARLSHRDGAAHGLTQDLLSGEVVIPGLHLGPATRSISRPRIWGRRRAGRYDSRASSAWPSTVVNTGCRRSRTPWPEPWCGPRCGPMSARPAWTRRTSSGQLILPRGLIDHDLGEVQVAVVDHQHAVGTC
jgi:hypothetical protein